MKKNLIPQLPISITLLLMLSLVITMTSCKSGTKAKSAATAVTKTGMPEDISGMKLEDIPGTDTKYARQMNASGAVEIEGFVRDNKKTGQWIKYGAEGDIGLINNYVDGKLEGVAMRMIYRNQVDLKSNYK